MTLSIIPYIVTLYIILIIMHLSLKTHHLTCMNCNFEFVEYIVFDDHYLLCLTCYDRPLFFLPLVLLCFPFCTVTSRVFNLRYQRFFYFNIFRSNHSSLEYSPQNIPLYYLTFHCLLLLFISFVISLTINIYKLHNSLPCFLTLVYLVLLAPIDSLVTLPDFDKSPPYF